MNVVAPPKDAEGGLFSETNDNSVGILLKYGAARVLLAGAGEAKSEEYMAGGPYTGPLTLVRVRKHTQTGIGLSRIARRRRLGVGGREGASALSHHAPGQEARLPKLRPRARSQNFAA
jgi:hypothetical protein